MRITASYLSLQTPNCNCTCWHFRSILQMHVNAARWLRKHNHLHLQLKSDVSSSKQFYYGHYNQNPGSKLKKKRGWSGTFWGNQSRECLKSTWHAKTKWVRLWLNMDMRDNMDTREHVWGWGRGFGMWLDDREPEEKCDKTPALSQCNQKHTHMCALTHTLQIPRCAVAKGRVSADRTQWSVSLLKPW